MRRKTSIKQSSHMTGRLRLAVAILLCLLSFYCPNINGATLSGTPTAVYGSVNVATSRNRAPGQFVIVDAGQAAPLYVDAEKDYPTEQLVANAFAGDVEAVSGTRPRLLAKSEALHAKSLIIIGTIGHSSLIDSLIAQGRINPSAIQGKWESALTTVIDHPFPHVSSALVIAGSDRRGTAFAVFDLSRHIGVSPWNWWADVPAKHHAFLAVNPGVYLQKTPSVRYRGIFLNDEDWGLRPWAARKMDPQLHNIGPHTYAHIFELLLRLRANTLWPAMHRGTLPFNAVPQNAILADRWGIVMGSAHNEPLLRNNIMTWNSHRNGPWNFQTNSAAILKYWDEGLKIDGKFENIYTMGMRGAGDTGMQATGTLQDKAALVGKIITEQRKLLAERVSPDVANIPQVLWLYKEVLGLYRAGMKLPDDVTIGWADDNYGYIREMPDRQEQARSGGSALYYHVSYFGEPHDYLWLCSTPPALMREELSKAWDHGIQRMWILNVGDLKPAEMDIDYFLRMAWDEPATAQLSQKAFIAQWSKEQFPEKYAATVANIMNRYYQLNFARKPEFMGFNENNRPITRTAFNPMAWGDQNQQRLRSWQQLSTQAQALSRQVPESYHDSYFELVAYPVEAAAAQNEKFLWNDRSYLDAAQGNTNLVESDSKNVNTAYNRIQTLTSQYNLLAHGKWDGIMSSHPRNLHAFDLPVTAKQNDQPAVLPQTWRAPSPNAATITDAIEGFREKDGTISIDATHFTAKHNGGTTETWHTAPDLGWSGGAIFFGRPGSTSAAKWTSADQQEQTQAMQNGPWLEYRFTTASEADARLSLYLLPTFPVDSEHKLRYGVILDGKATALDTSGTEERRPGVTPWSDNVLSNSEIQTLELGRLKPGTHTLRLVYGDPGVIFQHIVVTGAGAPPAYPFPPETGSWQHK